jgi:hypothetical protein
MNYVYVEAVRNTKDAVGNRAEIRYEFLFFIYDATIFRNEFVVFLSFYRTYIIEHATIKV